MPSGRRGMLAQWTGSLTSLTDYFSRLQSSVVPRLVYDFASPAAAKTAMQSDGDPAGRVFTVAGDRAIHILTGDDLDRIGTGAVTFATIISFAWTTGNAWSEVRTVSFGGIFGTRRPDAVVLQSLGAEGSTYDIRPKVLTAGDAYTPDLDASRVRVVAEARSASGSAPTSDLTRTCFLIAVRGVI